MTPSQQAKDMGLKSLNQVSEITGVCLNTLINWHRDKPSLFKTVLQGCKTIARDEAFWAKASAIARDETFFENCR